MGLGAHGTELDGAFLDVLGTGHAESGYSHGGDQGLDEESLHEMSPCEVYGVDGVDGVERGM
jgi:hypothetical protein